MLLLTALQLNAQKEDYVWTFGTDGSPEPGVQGMQIDFKDSVFQVRQIDMPFKNISSHASICDSVGNLLFYTNGCAVINRHQDVMPNGDTLNHDIWKEKLNWDDCRNGYPGQQNSVIIPDPGIKGGYYLFHKPRIYNGNFTPTSSELWITYVDMRLESGSGDVVYFDQPLFEEPLLSSYLEAIPHSNGHDWWVIQPVRDDSVFLTYLVDSAGIHRQPDQGAGHYFTRELSSAAGTARLSPDGTKYVYFSYNDNVHLYDVDRSTGLLSNHRRIEAFQNPDPALLKFASVEWSPNSRFLYLTNLDSLLQVDLWDDDIQSSIELIDTYDGTENPFPNVFYLQTLGPDCRIYISSTSSARTYHVIEKPNRKGEACQFRQNGIALPQSHGTANVPLFPRFRVDEIDKCDSTLNSVFGHLVYYRRDLSVYPNPAIDHMTIDIPHGLGKSQLLIYDRMGKVLRNRQLDTSNAAIEEDISTLPAGIYHVEIIPEKNQEQILYGCQVVKGG